eukprot:749418-Hanusia_phi.AAC.2
MYEQDDIRSDVENVAALAKTSRRGLPRRRGGTRLAGASEERGRRARQHPFHYLIVRLIRRREYDGDVSSLLAANRTHRAKHDRLFVRTEGLGLVLGPLPLVVGSWRMLTISR